MAAWGPRPLPLKNRAGLVTLATVAVEFHQNPPVSSEAAEAGHQTVVTILGGEEMTTTKKTRIGIKKKMMKKRKKKKNKKRKMRRRMSLRTAARPLVLHGLPPVQGLQERPTVKAALPPLVSAGLRGARLRATPPQEEVQVTMYEE